MSQLYELFSLKGKTAIVTGGGRGIGQVVALGLSKAYADTPKELKDKWMPLIPYHRMGKPEELIPAILYLCSDASGYTTGSDIIVDGGYVCV